MVKPDACILGWKRSYGGPAYSDAVAAYKDFLTLRKDADTDIPVLSQTKAEYAKLQ